MLSKSNFLNRSIVLVLWTLSGLALSQTATSPVVRSGYAPVNGLNLYFEIHGTGQPLVLIHGGLGTSSMFSEIMPALSQNRQVITLDLQGHGRTADIDRPITYEAMADDVAGLIRYLNLNRADVMGYSLGGEVALRTAIQHPDLVRKLIVVSATFRRDGWYPELLAPMTAMSAETAVKLQHSPMYVAYTKVAPRPQDWGKLNAKIGAMFRNDYDWSSEVAAIKAPTLLIFGDTDYIRPAHLVQFFELLGGGKYSGLDGSDASSARLAIIPNMTHSRIFSAPQLAPIANAFLDATPHQ
jgi:pimeloyl-ACP methyl ester carboxylesterase